MDEPKLTVAKTEVEMKKLYHFPIRHFNEGMLRTMSPEERQSFDKLHSSLRYFCQENDIAVIVVPQSIDKRQNDTWWIDYADSFLNVFHREEFKNGHIGLNIAVDEKGEYESRACDCSDQECHHKCDFTIVHGMDKKKRKKLFKMLRDLIGVEIIWNGSEHLRIGVKLSK